ncbi:reverse transcriptase N-terminal domain-containing protein [Streptomyces sp. NPDC004393]
MTIRTVEARTASDADGVVNGPEGDSTDWQSIDWQRAEEEVRRLRQRIFTASQAGDLKRVRNLQKLMLRSRSNTLVSVRRATEINAGRKTAGVDGRVVLLPQGKAELADWMQHRAAVWKPLPVKRVFVPKADGRQRGLGIPVIIDRCLQAVSLNALEPEWEARFEPRSYGFRPGRGCHDAIGAIFLAAKGKDPKRQWILDADLAAAFDRIDHDRLLAAIGQFPARGLVEQWLKAGLIDRGRFAPTEEGVPQGGIISPALMNVALHGMEIAAGVRYRPTGPRAGGGGAAQQCAAPTRQVESAYFAIKKSVLGRRVLRARTLPGIAQEIYALLTVYQAIRIAIADATSTVPGADPDRASFSIALHTARDQVVQAAGVIAGTTIDLVGAIDRAVLNNLMPARRLRLGPRAVKRPMSRYAYKSLRVARHTYKATVSIDILLTARISP